MINMKQVIIMDRDAQGPDHFIQYEVHSDGDGVSDHDSI